MACSALAALRQSRSVTVPGLLMQVGLTLIWCLERNEPETPALAIVISHDTCTTMLLNLANDFMEEHGHQDLPDNLTKLTTIHT